MTIQERRPEMISQEAPLFALTGKLAVVTGGAKPIGCLEDHRFSQPSNAEEANSMN